MSQSIGGKYTVRGPQRPGRLGSWQVVVDAGGQLRGALGLDPSALDQAAARRLSDVVRATNGLNSPGLLRLVDQAPDGAYLWLISSIPATPTLAQILAQGRTLPSGSALQIAVDLGQTLTTLHAASLAHGDVGPETTVLTGSGNVVLAECGFAHALAGSTPGPGHDTNGWVKTLRALAEARPADDARALLTNAADVAEGVGGAAGLAGALDGLTASAATIPGFGNRQALSALASGLAPSPDDAPTEIVQLEHSTLSPQELATRLGRLAAENLGTPPARPVTAAPPAPPFGSAPQDQGDGVLRFGRGVAAPPPARPAPAWTGETAIYEEPAKRRKSGGSRLTQLVSLITSLAILVVIGYLGWNWYQSKQNPLQLTGMGVKTSAPTDNQCDIQVDVIGTITSNGRPGTIQFEWIRSDAQTTGVLTQNIRDGATSTDVHLIWEFKGKGTYNAKATLKLLSPATGEASTEFVYSCK